MVIYDIAVIGAGSGGLSAAKAAARAGRRVALIEGNRVGGECAHTACVPSKALIDVTRRIQMARKLGEFGVRIEPEPANFAAVMGHVRGVIAGFQVDDPAEALREKGIELIRGQARFRSFDTLEVDGRPVQASRFIIAAGSRPNVPEIPGLSGVGYLDNRSVWDLQARPDSVAIIGGGVSGCEFGQALARLGVAVTILQRGPRLLPNEEPETSEAVRSAFEAEGFKVFTDVEVFGIARADGKKVVKFRGPEGKPFEAIRDEILVAAGRLANVENLGLEAVGIEVDPARGIAVDDSLKTVAPNIWAVGDVNGRSQYTHAAAREGEIAVRNALFREGLRVRRETIPRGCFVDPEVAGVGLVEAEAREVEPDLQVGFIKADQVDRPRIESETTGFLKVNHAPDGKILGASAVGKDATLVLAPLVLAIERGISLGDLADFDAIYPTRIGFVKAAANRVRQAHPQRRGMFATIGRLFEDA